MPQPLNGMKLMISGLLLFAAVVAGYPPFYNLLHISAGTALVPSRFGPASYVQRQATPGQYWGFFGMTMILVPLSGAFLYWAAWITLSP